MTDLPDRFKTKFTLAANGCWLWSACTTSAGYGQFTVGSRRDGSRAAVYAHRWAYEQMIGPIPEGLVLDHLCRKPSCVNPQHLEAVTQRENMRRSVVSDAGRSNRGAYRREKTHCPAGHPYAGDNLSQSTTGGRRCKTCRREGMARAYAEKRI